MVTFGDVASATERDAANAVIVMSLRARQAGDFQTQCATLSASAIEAVPDAKNRKRCPLALKRFAEPLSATKSTRKDTLRGSISVLRVKGDRGYALYHGTDGKDYAVPLEREADGWKVSSVLTLEL
jgi:hypothetical protein